MKNIIENNKLIAEFMGVFDKILSTGNIHSWSDAPYYYTTEDTREKVIKNISKYSKYDSDWNWLKLVLEKISYLNKDNFSDETKQALEDLLSLSLFSTKENVYKSIINFIKTIK